MLLVSAVQPTNINFSGSLNPNVKKTFKNDLKQLQKMLPKDVFESKKQQYDEAFSSIKNYAEAKKPGDNVLIERNKRWHLTESGESIFREVYSLYVQNRKGKHHVLSALPGELEKLGKNLFNH